MIYSPEQMYLLVYSIPTGWWLTVAAVFSGMSDAWGWNSDTRTDAVARGVMRATWVLCVLLLAVPASSGWLLVAVVTAVGAAGHRARTTWLADREQYGAAAYALGSQGER